MQPLPRPNLPIYQQQAPGSVFQPRPMQPGFRPQTPNNPQPQMNQSRPPLQPGSQQQRPVNTVQPALDSMIPQHGIQTVGLLNQRPQGQPPMQHRPPVYNNLQNMQQVNQQQHSSNHGSPLLQPNQHLHPHAHQMSTPLGTQTFQQPPLHQPPLHQPSMQHQPPVQYQPLSQQHPPSQPQFQPPIQGQQGQMNFYRGMSEPAAESVPDVFQRTEPIYASQNDVAANFQQLAIHPQLNTPINLLGFPSDAPRIAKTNKVGLIPYTAAASQHPSSVCDSRFKRCTLQQIPATQALLQKSKLPFGLILAPFKQEDQETEVPVINPELIVRCRRCRTYINPWVIFVDNNTRWRCNMCYLANDVPSFYDWDSEEKVSVDRLKRAELTHSVIEIVAPQEYMVRPPQPIVLLFIIDVSYNAISNGVLHSISSALMQALDRIPNTDGRTKVGFITVDSALHFYNLNASQSDPAVMIVSDLEEIYLPLPYDLLAPLTECRGVIESLLLKLPHMHASTREVRNVLGKAIQFAYKLVSPTGGKIIVLQSSLPTEREGALKIREDPKIYQPGKESVALQPAHAFYKNMAVDCSRAQISIDMFLFGGQYIDVATLSGCAKHSGGTTYYYQHFTAKKSEDESKFRNELVALVTRPLGLEAVLRVRASKGIRMDAFHGNFFLRSTDLMALPNVSPHHTYAVEMTIEENLVGNLASFQTALLYTADCGERRIRVLTMAVPVSNNLTDIFTGADPYAIAAFLTKKVLTAKLEDAREALLFKLVDIITAYRANTTSHTGVGQLLLSDNLKILPALILGLLKHEAFRQFTQVPLDSRAYKLAVFYSTTPELIVNMIYPRFYQLHQLDTNLPEPVPMNLSSEHIDRNGLYLMDAGTDIYFYMSRSIHPNLCHELFGAHYDELISGKCGPLRHCNPYTEYIANFVRRTSSKEEFIPTLWIMRETDVASKAAFLSCLVEDKMGEIWSYPQFLMYLKEQVGK